MKRTTRVMLLLALATMLLVFHVNTTSAKLTLLGGPTIVKAAHGSQSATSPRISLSDTDNTRGYELGVGGIGFTGGTAAAVYVLHDSSVAPSVLDDGANEAALCQRIIDQGASFGSAIVGSDGLVAVFGMVTVPTFIPGNHNYICMVDGAGRMSGTDVERFHLEHSIRVVPSAVTAGDSVTIFAQDYPSPGAGLTTLRVSGRSIAASSSSSVGADGSATVTFTIPSDLEGAVLVEAAWGNVSGTTRLVVTAAHFGELATRPSMVSASYAAETGAVEVTWKPDTTARQHWVVLFSLPDYEHGGRVLVRGVDADSVVFQDVPPGRYEALVASYSKDVGFKYGDDTTFELTIVAQEFDAATDRAALVDFYNATGGANWTNHANWLSNAPLGEWHGVNTDDAGRVTELRLLENGLIGPIPGTLGNLSNLNLINFGGNDLTGPIPTQLQNLGNLEELNLWENRLTGPVPDWLGSLGNLTRISLHGNQLSGTIPSELENLSALTHLTLSENLLTGELPVELGNLTKLELIRLAGNQFTGCIPDSLQPVADNDFNRLGLPVCQAEPTASLGPSTGEGPYSIVNNDLDYSYTISLTNAWDQEREGVYSRTFPWSQLRVTSQYIETGTNLKNFSETVRSGLRDEWWPNASLFDISSVEEVQLGDVPSYRMRYRVQESPQYCLVDVEEAIVISDALPGYPKGFRVRAWMCESQVRAHGSERGETLDSFRIVTIPSPYYQQFIFTNGVTVKATDGVDPAALRAGADIVVTMLSGRQDLARCMAQRGAALAIIPRDQPVTTLPEYAHLRGTYDFTGRSRDTFDLRGLGAAEPLHPVSSAGEEQLLGQFGPQHPYYPYRGWVAVHEFAHGIQNICFTAADDIRWREFYVAALNANLYPGTHMMADVKEFFAAFSTGYFEVTYELGPDSTRDSLKTRFPSVFESLDAIYGGATLPQEYREIIPR